MRTPLLLIALTKYFRLGHEGDRFVIYGHSLTRQNADRALEYHPGFAACTHRADASRPVEMR